MDQVTLGTRRAKDLKGVGVVGLILNLKVLQASNSHSATMLQRTDVLTNMTATFGVARCKSGAASFCPFGWL